MNAITKTCLRRLILVIAVAAMLICTQSAGAITTPNLLVDSGFENPVLTPFTQILGPPFTTGAWGGENAANVTGPDNGVNPAGGARMHRMDDDGLSATQSWQLVDVTPYSAAINANNATVNFGALFNVPQDLQAAVGSVGVSFLNAGHAPLPPLFTGVPATPDSNPASWQAYGLSGVAVPVNTSYIRMQVAYSNVTMQSAIGPNRPGFVDDARLSLTIVPEPSTMALGALALVSAIWMGRRR